MRKLFFVIGITGTIVALSLNLQAQEKQEEARYGYTLSSTVLSKYYGSIVGGIFYDRPLVFNDLNITRHDKYGSTYADFWMARPITKGGWNQDGGDEYDFTLGRTFGFSKNARGQHKVALDIAGTYLAVHPLTQMNAHVWTVFTRADFTTVKFVQPYVVAYYFGKTGQNSPPAGQFFYGGAQRNQKTKLSIGDRKVNVGFDYRFGFAGSALGTDWGPAYNRLSASVNLPIAKKFSITPSIIGQVPFHRNDPLKVLGDHSRMFATLTVSYHWGK